MDRAGFRPGRPTTMGCLTSQYLRCVAQHHRHAPKDEDELADMMFTATHEKHGCFIRYPRGAAEGVPVKDQPKLLEIGKAGSHPKLLE